MEFIEAMSIKKRICKFYKEECRECELSSYNNGTCETCSVFVTRYPEEAEKILAKWDKEHPVKTILQDFLEKYPNAKLDDDGIPKRVCPYQLGYDGDDGCIYDDIYGYCKQCWNRPMED